MTLTSFLSTLYMWLGDRFWNKIWVNIIVSRLLIGSQSKGIPKGMCLSSMGHAAFVVQVKSAHISRTLLFTNHFTFDDSINTHAVLLCKF